MTTTYDPSHPRYYDEADVRSELTRVFDLCDGCRLCFNLCPAFPSLFDLLDAQEAKTGETHGHAESLTVADQDRIVDECYQCKLCYVKCPYVPPHEWELDFPRLMMRANAQRVHAKSLPAKERITSRVLASTDLVGRASTLTVGPISLAGLVNSAMKPGSGVRVALERLGGVASQRLLPPYARQRFSTWFNARRSAPISSPRGEISLFPTCTVEYQEPRIGKDLVGVYERNGLACKLPVGLRCCGAPWLHAGEVEAFVAQAKHNVSILVAEVDAGREIVVPQPTCSYVIKRDYPLYLPTEEAARVAAATYDAAERLMITHKRDGGLDLDFAGTVPEAVTYHSACHLQAQNMGQKSRDLIKLTGAKVTLVAKCSGIDGTWGYRAENYEMSKGVAAEAGKAITKAGDASISGDCTLANTAIYEETGVRPVHPVSLLAAAYGLAEDGD